MAPSAINGDSPATPALPEEVSKPPAGVVLPPKDIRAIVEKTAGYVSRNGTVFEDRIREKEKHNPKFSFLSANDAYNPFYAWRLNEVREGRGTAVSAGRADEAAPVAEPEKPKGPATPPDFHFSARMPNINAQDLEVVRLTALFVAKNGRSFMTALSQKETRNYQFDFLRPQHSLYQFFSRLVDQYTELLQAGSVDGGKAQKATLQELQQNMDERFHILGRAKQRAEWVKFQEEQKQRKEEEAEKEKLEYAQIDWHDFVVVETVLFNEADDQADLPPPTSLNDLQSASLEQKAMMSLQPHNMRIEEAMPGEEIYYNPYPTSQQQYSMQPPPAAPSYNTYPPQQQQQQEMDHQPTHQPSTQEDDEARAIAERTEARERAQAAQAAAKGGAGQPMRIRNDYVPRAQAKRQNMAMALCPNCKQQIPFDELDQHMRIELLDPRWKEQRAKSDLRQSTTNLSTSDVAANLKRLASQRSDVFDGVTGQPVISEEEAARRKKAATSYDGQLEKGREAERERMQGLNIEEQIRQIHQKFRS
ncbi:SF3a splicing factor complex subunit [Hypocenomyce scalaris]|nr:SF3a splicing factor complex subunit [Hypocenomyce scalaris]